MKMLVVGTDRTAHSSEIFDEDSEDSEDSFPDEEDPANLDGEYILSNLSI